MFLDVLCSSYIVIKARKVAIHPDALAAQSITSHAVCCDTCLLLPDCNTGLGLGENLGSLRTRGERDLQ